MPPERLTGRIVDGVGCLPQADWTACFPNEAEGWAYYRACERHAPTGLRPGAAAVFDDQGLLAAAPLFTMGYRLDTPLQGSLREWVARVAARWRLPIELRLLAVGSPYAERCHLAVRPGLAPARRLQAIEALAAQLEQAAAARRCTLVAFKDVAPPDAQLLRPLLAARGYAEIASLPVAVLDLAGYADADAYLGALSRGTRRDIRRKLRSRARLRIEHRTDIEDVADQIGRLYESTRCASEVRYGDLEELPRDYFRAVGRAAAGQALHVLYWVGDELAGFNLLLLEPDRLIDKFLGMRYPLGPQHDLYAVSWVENVRLAIATGRRYLQTGQTAYGEKLRLGSALVPSALFARARPAPLRPLLRAAAPWLAFDRWDPELRGRAGAA